MHSVLVHSGGSPGSTASVSVNSQRFLMYLLPQLFLLSGMPGRLCSFSWCSLLERRYWDVCTVDKQSSARFLDQRREKLSSLGVTLLSLSFSDPPAHLIII